MKFSSKQVLVINAHLIKWLGDISSWVLDQMKEIFAKAKEAFQLYVNEVTELFQYLWSQFESGLKELTNNFFPLCFN